MGSPTVATTFKLRLITSTNTEELIGAKQDSLLGGSLTVNAMWYLF